MTRFTVELQYLLPVFVHRTIDAPDPATAMRTLIDADDWEGQKEDYESSRPTYVTAAWEGDEAYPGGSAGTVEIPPEFAESPNDCHQLDKQPAIKALIEYAVAAPASDPGEGWWEDLDATFGCGERAAQFEAAEKIRSALRELGIEPPKGRALCEGCSRFADENEHDPDCTLEGEKE